MHKNGSPPPAFEFDDEHLYFQVTLPIHPMAANPTAGDQVTPQSPPKSKKYKTEALNRAPLKSPPKSTHALPTGSGSVKEGL